METENKGVKVPHGLGNWFENEKQARAFVLEHPGVEVAELFRLASSGNGQGKSHMSGCEDGDLKPGRRVGVSRRKGKHTVTT